MGLLSFYTKCLHPGGNKGIRDPFLTLLHLFGALFGIIFFLFFTTYSNLEIKQIVALCVYELTFVFLFLASSLFHGRFHKNQKEEEFYEKLDYIGIYLFIAGTYTPICLQTLNNSLATWVLSAEWGIALLGCLSILIFGTKARILLTVIFLIMGWIFIAVGPSIDSVLSSRDLSYLISGAMFYSVGALVFALAPKRICNNKICTHAIWHIFVLAGALAHLLLITSLIGVLPL